MQRLSTIFEFMGELKDGDGNKLPPSTLSKTKMLPSLEGMTWNLIPKEPLQIDFRRTKIEIKIIKSSSSKNAKFEVFQWLNYSSPLSGQEFRNAVLIMLDIKLYEWLKDLAEYSNFSQTLDLTDRWKDEQYDYELALRLFIFSRYAEKPIYKVDDFINDFFIYDEEYAIIKLIERSEFDIEIESNKFKKTFDLLLKSKGKDVFKKMGGGRSFWNRILRR